MENKGQMKLQEYKKQTGSLPTSLELDLLRKFRFLIKTTDDCIPSHLIQSWNCNVTYANYHKIGSFRDQIQLKLVVLLDKNFLYEKIFNNIGKFKLELKYLDGDGVSIKQVNYNFCMIERAGTDGDYNDCGFCTATLHIVCDNMEVVNNGSI